MSAEPEAYTCRDGVWVPRPQARPPAWRWDGRQWVRGRQYTSEDSPETWARALDEVFGPEDGLPCR